MQINDLSGSRIMQTAFVTTDIERCVREFGRDFGVGGWAIISSVAFTSMLLRGKPCEAQIRAAVAFQGNMMYEFIQPLDLLPSVYRNKSSNELLLGFHHFARVVSDLPAAIACYGARGYSVAMDARVAGGGRAVYMEARDPLTGMVELFEGGPAVDAFLDATAQLEAPLSDGEVTITYW